MASAPSGGSQFLDGGIWKVHVALIVTQLGAAGYYVLTKAALSDGLNPYVFAVYRNLIGVVLVASSGFFLEKGQRTRLTPYILGLLLLGGFTGIFGNQAFFLTGLALTSTAYAAAMQIANPMFTFLIAVLFRIEDITFSKRHGQAKVLGVFFSLAGACLMTFYQGPIVLGSESDKLLQGSEDKLALYTPALLGSILTQYGITAWQFGSACLVANTLCMGIYVNLQAPILARYPAPLSETAIAMSFGCIMLLVTGLITVQDSSAWIVTNKLDVVSVFYAGTMASGLNFALNTWCFQRSGPFLVGAYIPLQPVVSAIFGLIFLGDVVYLGSVLGALLVLMGLYLITWGKVQSKKDVAKSNLKAIEEPSLVQSDIKQPLINGHQG